MYAHATIEDPATGKKYLRGEEVPADIAGVDELVEAGSLRDEPYDPDAEPAQHPETVEIDGVTYVKAADGAEAGDAGSR